MVASDRVNLFWVWQYVITMRYLKMEPNVQKKKDSYFKDDKNESSVGIL